MKEPTYQVSFNTPAFLGNAEQQAQWRTPPFKALIRQWWRVAAGHHDANRLRETEGQLFGAANDEGGGSQKSRVRIRLEHWHQPQIGVLPNAGKVCHPEVDRQGLPNCPDGGGKLVDAGQYLGYGPFQKPNAAIQADETNTLRLAWPDGESTIADALQLIHWFGALGGRSRNGWGSLALKHDSIAPVIPAQAGIQNGHLLHRIAMPLADCLRHDWPHALGQSADGRLLIWKSAQTFANWRESMQALAKAKIGFRTNLKIEANREQHGEIVNGVRRLRRDLLTFERRHVLSYPLTNHGLLEWGKVKTKTKNGQKEEFFAQEARLANQLRFKVAKNAEDRLVAYIFHLPCALPRELAQDLGRNAPTIQQQAAIWQMVHSWLDNTSAFQRI